MTTVREIMTPGAHWLTTDATVADAAKIMRDHGVGLVPVGENEKMVGMITDRDIAVRAVADERAADKTPVTEIMSEQVLYCRDDDDVNAVAANMGDVRVRRLPVVNDQKRLVGMVSLGDIAARGSATSAGLALSGVSGEAEW